MKTLYLDCGMGASGDMLTAALLELLPSPDDFIEVLNSVGIPDVRFFAEKSVKCGITGTHVTVNVNGEKEHRHEHGHSHHHRGMCEIELIIASLNVSEEVRGNILGVYRIIADAESAVHGVPVSDIHFHEVGTADAIADITAVCLLMEKLLPQRIVVSSVHVGSGQVKCAHGILPVPAPATAHILRGVPIYGGSVKSELCTPTGAALLRFFASSFGDMPVMSVERIGCGMGTKDFETTNCVRAFLGDTEDLRQHVCELRCNIDDMTAEDIGYAVERLFEAGALDVFTVPVGMKKSRPATLICALCTDARKESVVRAMFTHTSTIGIRENACTRYVMERTETTVSTRYGDIRKKDSFGYGVKRTKYEHEDLARAAKEYGLSIADVLRNIERG